MEKGAAKGIDPKVLDELVAGVQSSEDFKDLLKQLNKGLIERVLEAEMTHHLGHESGGVVTNAEGNTRNGKGKKKVQGDFGQVELSIPMLNLSDKLSLTKDFFKNHLTISLWKYLSPFAFHALPKSRENALQESVSNVFVALLLRKTHF
jgi:hypothetical protein